MMQLALITTRETKCSRGNAEENIAGQHPAMVRRMQWILRRWAMIQRIQILVILIRIDD